MQRLIPTLLASAVLVTPLVTPPVSPLVAQDYADAMHRAHAHEVPTASPAALVAPRTAVIGEVVTYGTEGGTPITGYLAKPAKAPSSGMPALIVVHEWWGLNENIRAVADRYAGEGYTVLAVDIFGSVATTSADAMKQYRAAMADIPKGERNLAAAIGYLEKAGATSIGSVGYCFGGHWSLRTGLVGGDDVDAVVMYYGAPITQAEQLTRLKAPVLGLFGSQDRGIPVDSVRAMEAAMKSRGTDVAIQVYDANHAFANPSGQAYDKAAADDAWERSLTFFRAHLK